MTSGLGTPNLYVIIYCKSSVLLCENSCAVTVVTIFPSFQLHLDAQELHRLLEFTNRPNVQDQLRKAIEEIEEKLAQSKPAPESAGPSDTDGDSSKTKSGHGFLPVAKIKTYGKAMLGFRKKNLF